MGCYGIFEIKVVIFVNVGMMFGKSGVVVMGVYC